ncbi:MAG: hypothetical protein AMK75_04355, partial [Planctomycetes bacterium SM23_65]
MLNDILFALKDYWEFMLLEIQKRGTYEWFLFMFPFFIFGETPRYIIPAMVTAALSLFHIPHGRTKRTRAFLETRPSVSIVVAAHDEEEVIVENLTSLVELPYDNKEIILVDDHST